MPPSSRTMLSDSESSSHDGTQAHDNDVNQHHTPFHFISSQIQVIITQISDALHQVQQRKGQQVIIGYNYKMDCDISPNNNNSNNSNAESDSSPAWNIVTTPKTSSVDRVLENWKYQGEDLQDDGLFLSYIDLSLDTFDDLERVTDLLVEIGAKYVDNMRENHKTAAGFEILFDNMGKIRAALEVLCVATTDAVDNIGEDNDVKKNMDQLMVCYRNVCEKLPVSLKMEGKCDVAGRGVSLDILDDDDEDEDVKDVIDIGNYTNLELEETMKYHSYNVNDLKAYSIDGIDYVASCSDDKTVKICRLEDRSVVATLTGHTNLVYSLELYKKRDGTQCLASCSHDGCIKLWNLHRNSLITTLQNLNYVSAYSLAHFVKDEKPYLVCGYGNGDIVVWDLESHNVVATLRGHSGYVLALDVMEKNDRQYLVSTDDDGKISVWNLETYELVKAINNAHDNVIWSLTTFVHDGKLCIASGDDEGKIKIWDVENYSLMSTLEGHTYQINDINVCQSGGVTMLASASGDDSIKFWRLNDMSLSHTLTSTDSVESLEFVKDVGDKMMVISCGGGGNLSFWKEKEN